MVGFRPVSVILWVKVFRLLPLSFATLFILCCVSPQLTKADVEAPVIQEIVADVSERLPILTSFGVTVALAPILKIWFFCRKKTPATVPKRRMMMPIIVGILYFFIISNVNNHFFNVIIYF